MKFAEVYSKNPVNSVSKRVLNAVQEGRVRSSGLRFK